MRIRVPAGARSRRATLSITAVVAAVVIGGCGVPIDRSPSALPRGGIPFGLLRPVTTATATTTVPSPVGIPVQIFLVDTSGHLVGVTRQVPVVQESLTAVLDALVAGPTSDQTALGLQSALPVQTKVLGATLGAGGVATVNLGGTFGQLVGQQQIEAVAQVVFTATTLPGVTGVTFELSGVAVDVPVASGALVTVTTRAQFASLAPVVAPGAVR